MVPIFWIIVYICDSTRRHLIYIVVQFSVKAETDLSVMRYLHY